MTTIITQDGVIPALGPITNTYTIPSGKLMLDGMLWGFKIRDSDIVAQVQLRINDITERTVGIGPFKHITNRPRYVLTLESRTDGFGGQGDILSIIDRQGNTLRYNADGEHMERGYGTYLLKQAESFNFGLTKKLIDKVFDPLEGRVRQHYAKME